jgi:hypothetical protein
VRIAVLERFSEPSRRCDIARLVSDPDDVVLLDLAVDAGERKPSLAQVTRSLIAWVALREPLRERCKLLLICARMRGTRRAALVRVPGWIEQLRAGEFDQVACYSARRFELVRWFASATGHPCVEQLALGTHFYGEFAFEHLAVIPYAYWLHQQGQLEFTVATADTACFYYFSPNHTEVSTPRTFIRIREYPVADLDADAAGQIGFPRVLDTTRWRPPPYREVYADDGRFRFPKPIVIVCNKANEEPYEPGRFAVNYLDTDLLLTLLHELTPRFTVVYNRPRAADIVTDHAEIRELGDIEAVKREFPEVLTIQELHAEHDDLTFNELQLRLFATCERFVSVLGGASYLASYFGGTNIVYAKSGWEVDCDAYNGWFHLFSGARVVAVATPDDLLRTVRAELLDRGDT